GEGGPVQSLRYVRGQVYGLSSFDGISSPTVFGPIFRHSSPPASAGAHPAPRGGGGCSGAWGGGLRLLVIRTQDVTGALDRISGPLALPGGSPRAPFPPLPLEC